MFELCSYTLFLRERRTKLHEKHFFTHQKNPHPARQAPGSLVFLKCRLGASQFLAALEVRFRLGKGLNLKTALEWTRLRKLLEQKDFGRIEGVPAVACRAIARSATADPVRFFQSPAANRLRKTALSNCRFTTRTAGWTTHSAVLLPSAWCSLGQRPLRASFLAHALRRPKFLANCCRYPLSG